MSEQKDARFVREVACCFQRVVVCLSGEVTHVAHQLDPETRNIEIFRSNAFGHAEMLEREARNIRDSIARHRKG